MGKETEIFQAAQEGNLTKLESIFSQKGSKVFSGLFKGPNVNFRDSSGCTALHLAALHGHKDIVIFLLHNDASANMPDNAGSYPLHLAAFNGHYEVAKILLLRGPSRADVNETNIAGDTALHVAAQYGHRHVAQVLLEQHADARLRNAKQESPLDLASQYGRLSTVQLFLFFNPSILQDAVHKHSPLHLAARNGHKDVVTLLLDNGMPVNATCDMGTALHCAALYGKVDVARILLEKGIDINIEDSNGQIVMDFLCSHPSQRSQEITALIYENTAKDNAGKDKARVTATSYSGKQFEVVETKRHHTVAASQNIGRYDTVPPPRPKEAVEAENYRPYSILHQPQKSNRLSDNEENFDLAMATPLDSSGHHKGFFKSSEQQDADRPYCLVGDVTTKGKVAIKQFRTQSFNKHLEQDSYIELSKEFPSKPLTSKSQYTFGKAEQSLNSEVYQIPAPLKPLPQDSIYQHPSSFPEQYLKTSTCVNESTNNDVVDAANQYSGDVYDNHSITNVRDSRDDVYFNVNITNKPVVENTRESMSYDNVNITNKPDKPNVPENDTIHEDSYYQDPTNITPSTTTSSDMKNLKTKSVKQKRTGGNIKREASLEQIDESSNDYSNANDSNNNYDIVPTLKGRENMNTETPRSEIETSCPDETSTLNDSSMDTQLNKDLPTSQLNKDLPTLDTVSDNKSNNLKKDSKTPAVTKPPRTKIKQQRTSKLEDRSVSGGYRMSFLTKEGPLDETYEWNKIDNFLSDLTEFAKTDESKNEPDASSSTPVKSTTPSVPQVKDVVDVATWLESLQLSQYEPVFLANGFDDIKFMAGVIEDQDLIELGILDVDHRNKILESANKLEKVCIIGEGDTPIPTTILEWLEGIKLREYENRFIQNGYENMDRIRVIWELELVTVIDISMLGHRKRMMYSLGRRPPDVKGKISWVKRFADADAGKKKPEKRPDNSMEVAQKLLETADQLKSPSEKQANTEKPKTRTSISLDSSDSKSGSRPQSPSSPSSPDNEGRKSKENPWKHDHHVLLFNCVSYTVQYLGSHPVQQVKGVESTLEACNKMRSISRNVRKMPHIILSISVRGIDYIDSNSKMVISEYNMTDISFCTEDPKDLQVFAYITRDQYTRKNYCHVFKADTRQLADEIILTIGQCFQLAYEQYKAMTTFQKSNNSKSQEKGPPPVPRPYADRKKE